MHTTVVLGCPMEQAAESELVPTPDESLIMSLVSPRDLSVLGEGEKDEWVCFSRSFVYVYKAEDKRQGMQMLGHT